MTTVAVPGAVPARSPEPAGPAATLPRGLPDLGLSGVAGGGGEYCARFQSTIELIGRRWSASILRALLTGAHRFCEISSTIPGISHRLVSERLAELIDAGLVAPEEGGRGYHLTEAGADLADVFEELDRWNRRWVDRLPADG